MHSKPNPLALGWPFLLAFFFQNFSFAQTPSGLPVPCRKGALWGLADPADGRTMLLPYFDTIGTFHDEHGNYAPLAWAKKDDQFSLINRSGEIVLPGTSPENILIEPIQGSFFSARKFAFGAKNSEEEGEMTDGQYFAFCPIAYFDSMGRAIGRPFEFETYVSLEEDPCGGSNDTDPSGFGGNIFANFAEIFHIEHVYKHEKLGLFDLNNGQILVKPRWKTIDLRGPNVAIGRLGSGNQFDENAADSLFIIHFSAGEKAAPWPANFEFSDQYSSFSEDRFLAKDPATGLFGYIDRAGEVAIPFVFKEARTFSRGGLAMAQRDNGTWHIIDRAGRDSVELGPEPAVLRDSAGVFWTKKAGDGLFRKVGATASDPLGSFGFDWLPQKVVLGGREFWQGSRHGLSGLLNPDFSVALPFEYGHARQIQPSLRRDSAVHAPFFTVFLNKNNHQNWLFDSRTMQPLRPKLLPGSGLVVGQNIAESNFSLEAPLVGDSLFSIWGSNPENRDRVYDVLNIRTGRRWFLPENPSQIGVSDWKNSESVIIVHSRGNGGVEFSVNGKQISGSSPNFNNQYWTRGFGFWNYIFDEATGLTAVLDSSDHELCKLKIPFDEPGNSLQIVPNNGSIFYPFVILATSPTRRSAVFSLAGKLLSPPYIYNANVSNDLIFAEMFQKKGAYRLTDGKEVVPCTYREVYFYDGQIAAIDFEGTEFRFDLREKNLFSFGKGTRTWRKSSEGLQLVRRNGAYGFLDEKREPVFWLPEGQQPSPFSDGFSWVFDCATEEQFFVNKVGKNAFGELFLMANSFENGLAIVRTKSGEWQVINTVGDALLSHSGGENSGIERLKNDLFALKTGELSTLVTIDGQTVLKDCGNYEMHGDSVFFFSSDKFGCRLPDGSIKDLGAEHFKIKQKTQFGEIVSVDVAGGGEGFRRPDGQWLIEPKNRRQVMAGDEWGPFIHLSQYKTGKSEPAIFDTRSGEKIPVEPFDRFEFFENLGWLLTKEDQNGETVNAFLYSPDFVKIRVIPTYWSIEKEWGTGLFYATDYRTGQFLGYFSRNGKVLFED